MARKKTVKNEEEEFEVDEPSEVDEGANEDGQNDTNSSGRRTSARSRTVKKPYRGEDSTPDEDEDEDGESEEEKKPKKRGAGGASGGRGGGGGRGRGRGRGTAKPPPKKQKVEEENEDSEDDEGDESDGDAADTPAEFRSGCFVALKTDIDNKVDNHPVWKIDGKSLLQKFDRFTHEGETLYKSTTIYAGWSKTILETYYPIKVDYKKVPGHDSCVKFDPSQMANVVKESKEKENNKEKELKEETNDEKKEEEEDEDGDEEEDGK